MLPRRGGARQTGSFESLCAGSCEARLGTRRSGGQKGTARKGEIGADSESGHTGKARPWVVLRSRGGDLKGRGAAGGGDKAKRGTAPRLVVRRCLKQQLGAAADAPATSPAAQSLADVASRLPQELREASGRAGSVLSRATYAPGRAGSPEAKRIGGEAQTPACRCLQRKPPS